jgi:diacylglycerol kinase family enzyme
MMAATPEASGKLVLVVINPATRRGADQLVAAIRRHTPPGVELDVRETMRERPVADLIADRLGDASIVVACGGDGTVADVVTALSDSDVPVGIIPGGSTNVIARENRIPLQPDAAARLIFGKHRIARLDVGLSGHRRFLHMAGAGLDSRLFAATNPALKRRLGWPAYVPAAIRNLVARPVRFTITVDGMTVTLRSALVLVANGAGIVRPWLPIYPGLRRDDGLLDVIAFTPVGPIQIGRTLLRFATRRLDRSPYVVRLQGREIALHTDPPIPYQLDGDVVGTTPATFRVIHNDARIIVPVD